MFLLRGFVLDVEVWGPVNNTLTTNDSGFYIINPKTPVPTKQQFRRQALMPESWKAWANKKNSKKTPAPYSNPYK